MTREEHERELLEALKEVELLETEKREYLRAWREHYEGLWTTITRHRKALSGEDRQLELSEVVDA